MIAIPYITIEKAIKDFDSEISKYQMDLKTKLLTLKNDSSLNATQKKYVKKLIDVSRNIIAARPSTIENYKRQFNKIVSSKTVKGKTYNNFRSKLLTALGYSKRRGDFYPQYFHRIGIMACVYCNSMLTVSAKKVNGKKESIQARFQVDHYLPKSEYPCFSVSLYNLYPTCASCNNVKGTKNVQFKLYEKAQNIGESDFYFELNMVSVGDYLLNRDSNLIQYEFQEPKVRSKDIKTFNEIFAIQGIYDTQKSIAEELILKAEIYTKAYKDQLISKYQPILSSASITDRLIMGNYTSGKDMHKRPMAKFMIDIAKQVGLI